MTNTTRVEPTTWEERFDEKFIYNRDSHTFLYEDFVELKDFIRKERERAREAVLDEYDFPTEDEVEEMQEKDKEVRKQLIAGGTAYLGEHGNVISEEDYFDFEDHASSVGLPEGSHVERFIPIKSQPKEANHE